MGSHGLNAKYTIAIIGSGPAGLSAAARAAARGVPHVLLEKTEHLSDTIFKYQKGKHIMATPEQLILRSDIDFDAGSRENILDLWNEQAENLKTNVRYNSEVIKVEGSKPNFKLTLKDGSTVESENIILAIGTQGNPNTMRCPGGDLPHVQYQLDDPRAYFDEDIIVIGGGDAGIENALGLCAAPELENRVTLLQRAPDFPKAKAANVKALMEAKDSGRLNVINLATTISIEPNWINIDVKDGKERLPCDRIIARIGSAPPRKFVESCGVEFASEDRLAFPVLSESFETSVPGLYVIGALAGYPLIKHCMNQGYDVVEQICGNTSLKPADEPLLQEKLNALPGRKTVNEWLNYLRKNIDIFNPLSLLQMREFMLDSEVSYRKSGETIFKRNDIGSSLFSIASGTVNVHIDKKDESITVPISAGKIFGETGLISGRRRNAMITVAEDCILVETPRNAARKLIASVPEVKRNIERIAIERQLLNIFGPGITQEDIAPILDSAKLMIVKANTIIIEEGETG
ncbi:MAG TPA: cyclic nucleotide-binding domain-containing protein, partial [Gammaproteobacteria bacterium]|nr:cyclic nucleotide-binding domain-containing protein [Gammaproteobacteria bacterium]